MTPKTMRKHDSYTVAAEQIAESSALVVCAGAGMGVDSGLPDFRGDEGFWRAYPAFRAAGHRFVELANPHWFERDPALAWGFYGHRLHLYRNTTPHEGFSILRRWCAERFGGGFAFTSNVDGQFQKAGFDDASVVECHGSLMHLQCSAPCAPRVWDAGDVELSVDTETMRAAGELPRCPRCGALARPAVLMFNDWAWAPTRTDAQFARYERWLSSVEDEGFAVIEIGAGTAVPTVRRHSEMLHRQYGAAVVRINPRESHGPAGIVPIAETAVVALRRLDEALHAL